MTRTSFIVVIMDFQSLSGIVIAVIALIVLVGFVPWWTMRSLKNATRHAQDKYSASLHVVKESGSKRPQKGSSRSRKDENALYLSDDYVQKMRQNRKREIKIRQVLVALSLLSLVVTAVCAWYFSISFMYLLIPLGLLGIILGLGVYRSEQARVWEARVKAARVKQTSRSLQLGNGLTQYAQYAHYAASAFSSDEMNSENEEVDFAPLHFSVDDVDTLQFRQVEASDVHSREIVSFKQVAKAVPPEHEVKIPSHDDDRLGNRDEGAEQLSERIDSILEMRRQ